ncbi:MAG: DJ-1/PfpI family protein [Parvularculaceae bacterium]|nr:DJ-1/PfpI family protein [Parvularculaceae bacterium]
MKTRSERRRDVVVLAYQELCLFEFAVAVEAFGLPRPELGPDWYRLRVASLDPPPLRATSGVTVSVDGGLDLLAEADVIVLPGWKSLVDDPPTELLSALRRAHERGARLVSICSGVFALAATGLLDGLRATTHWKYVDRLQARFPAVRVERDVLYVDEGAILTSAGSAAGIDLCLHIIRRDFGARDLQKYLH